MFFLLLKMQVNEWKKTAFLFLKKEANKQKTLFKIAICLRFDLPSSILLWLFSIQMCVFVCGYTSQLYIYRCMCLCAAASADAAFCSSSCFSVIFICFRTFVLSAMYSFLFLHSLSVNLRWDLVSWSLCLLLCESQNLLLEVRWIVELLLICSILRFSYCISGPSCSFCLTIFYCEFFFLKKCVLITFCTLDKGNFISVLFCFPDTIFLLLLSR